MNPLLRYRRWIALAALASSLILIGYATLSPPPAKTPHPPPPSPPTTDTLLPIASTELATAADLARRFITAYGTYRYDETPETYLARLEPMTNPQLHQQLERAARNPTVLATRQRDQMTATASAQVTATRDIQAGSIIFLVTGHQRIEQAGHTSQSTETFALTLTKQGNDWTVASLRPASTGQQGDEP